jgi:hypothetical protein
VLAFCADLPMNTTEPAEDSVATTETEEILTQPEAAQAEPEQQTEDSVEEVVITIKGESPTPEEEEKQAPEWVKNLRKSYRELQREKRELEEKLKMVLPAAENNPVVLGRKPTLEACDYDSDKFENELSGWFERKRQSEEAEAKQRTRQQSEQDAWQKKLEGYNQSKTGLKVSDFTEAEETVLENLSVTQQGIILQGAQNPAVMVYALGKNPKKAKELAEIKDPVAFAFAVAKLETQLSVTRKQLPPPEKRIVSNGNPGTSSVQLDRLRDEAARTGDFTKVIAFKKQLKNQS